MARARDYSVRDKVRTLLQFSRIDKETGEFVRRTQKELARELNVSERTIRRWKNEGVEPSPKHAPALNRAARRERERLYRQGAVRTHVPPPAKRRLIKERDELGKPTGRLIPSEWTNYDVREQDTRGQFEVLKAIQESGRRAQIIIKIGHGAKKGQHARSGALDLEDLSDAELYELLIEWTDAYDGENTILYIGALD